MKKFFPILDIIWQIIENMEKAHPKRGKLRQKHPLEYLLSCTGKKIKMAP